MHKTSTMTIPRDGLTVVKLTCLWPQSQDSMFSEHHLNVHTVLQGTISVGCSQAKTMRNGCELMIFNGLRW